MNDTVSIIFFHMQKHFVLISWGMSQLLFRSHWSPSSDFPRAWLTGKVKPDAL